MPRDIEQGMQAGFFRYLTKPIKVDEFMDTLDQALKFADRNCSLSESRPMIRPADIHSARILIVDDQAANIALLERMLTGAGYGCRQPRQ